MLVNHASSGIVPVELIMAPSNSTGGSGKRRRTAVGAEEPRPVSSAGEAGEEQEGRSAERDLLSPQPADNPVVVPAALIQPGGGHQDDAGGSEEEEKTVEDAAEAVGPPPAMPLEVYEVLCRLLITDKHIRSKGCP